MEALNVNKNHDKGFQSDLAKRMGISRQNISAIFTGKVIPGKKMARRLEEHTGVNREVWMYPDEHPNNPLIKKNSNAQPNK